MRLPIYVITTEIQSHKSSKWFFNRFLYNQTYNVQHTEITVDDGKLYIKQFGLFVCFVRCFVCLFICLFVCLFVCLNLYYIQHKRLNVTKRMTGLI